MLMFYLPFIIFEAMLPKAPAADGSQSSIDHARGDRSPPRS
jgi:hypothetical protein